MRRVATGALSNGVQALLEALAERDLALRSSDGDGSASATSEGPALTA